MGSFRLQPLRHHQGCEERRAGTVLERLQMTTQNVPWTTWANWSRKRASEWHLTTCLGTNDDKLTACGKRHRHYAEWSRSVSQDDLDIRDRLCADCLTALRERLVAVRTERGLPHA